MGEGAIRNHRHRPLTNDPGPARADHALCRAAASNISIRVDATTFINLKGQVLMRSYELLASAETAFAFRDPFGTTWEMTLQGSTSVM